MSCWYLFVVFTVTVTSAADYFTHFVRNKLDHTVSPCENFYRHVCSKNMPWNETLLSKFDAFIENKRIFSKDYFILQNKTFYKDMARYYFEEYDSFSETTEEAFKQIRTIPEAVKIVDTIKVYGQEFVHLKTVSIFEEMKGIFLDQLLDTPWIQNHHVLGEYAKALSNLALLFEFDETRTAAIKLFSLFEDEYLKCKNSVGYDSVHSHIDCFMTTFNKFGEKIYEFGIVDGYNAFNAGNTHISLGFSFFLLTRNDIPLSLQLGLVGTTIGHELGHTFFQPSDDEIQMFSYFSQNILECTKKQFQSGCHYFKEGKCYIETKHLDEAASDLLGNQLAYTVLRRRVGEKKLQELVQGLNVTHQQLFFYSNAIYFCGQPTVSTNDGHPPSGLRVNSIVQLPEFQEAFGCTAESKMMLSKTEECHMYGNQAPKVRR